MPSRSSVPSTDVADSWKEIAAYLKRDVRTVMRWEHTCGLPVHRLPGGPKSAVYAMKSELELWRRSREIHEEEKRSQPAVQFSSSAAAGASIAVLPFVNLSAEKENEYFSDGLADEIITALAHVEGLRVTARTSSFAFRGEERDVREIGAKLGVATLLEGSVQREGGRVRVSAQLVSSSEGHHIWADHYDRELTDLFAVQDEIAACIAAALELKVKPQAPRGKRPNAEAYQSWLRGRYYQFNRRTLQDVTTAGECFSRAIALDPDFGAAHLAIGQHLLDMAVLGLVPPQQVAAEVRLEVEKALQWDDGLGEAHAALGIHRALFDFDWPGAESAFRRALACDPGSPAILRAHVASVLAPTMRLEEAEKEVLFALELDPLSPDAHFLRALMLFFRRQYDQAEASIRTTLELGSTNPFAQWVGGIIAALQGRFEAAITQCEGAVRLFGRIPMLSAGLGMVYGWAGRTAEARRMLELIEEAGAATYVSPIYRAWVYMGLGEVDNAFQWMDRAIQVRDPHILHLPV
ncbi:MAG: tetratricopeptide repeat protein, partial [Bryobacteraceae bacterium]